MRVLMIVHDLLHNTTLNTSDNLRFTLQTVTTVQLLPIEALKGRHMIVIFNVHVKITCLRVSPCPYCRRCTSASFSDGDIFCDLSGVLLAGNQTQ